MLQLPEAGDESRACTFPVIILQNPVTSPKTLPSDSHEQLFLILADDALKDIL
jgi:hypothetical protein